MDLRAQLASVVNELGGIENLDAVRLDAVLNDDRYAVTPPDVIPFAWTHGDGIHFGVVTDFGEVTQLRDAFVVCVSPSDDPAIRVVARNIHEFLALVCRVKESEALSSIDLQSDERSWLRDIEKKLARRPGATSSGAGGVWRHREDVSARASGQRLRGCVASPQSPRRLHRARDAGRPWRARLARRPPHAQTPSRPYDFQAPGAKDPSRLGDFLRDASSLERLAFCRDAQHGCIFAKDYDVHVARFMASVLRDMGLDQEATNIEFLL